MIKKLVLATLFLFVYNQMVSAQEEDVSQAKWQENKIIIDGEDNEWTPPFNLFDNNSGMIFTISNDKKNLYLCFAENEELKAEKLMKAGWSFELSSSEKKRKFNVSVAFPKIDDQNIKMRADYTNQVGYYKMDLATVKIKGFVSNNGDIPLMNKEGVSIGIGSSTEQKIIYEIAIPIQELIKEDKLQLNELITLDVTINALDKPTGSQPSGGRYSGGGGRSGGSHMGGGGGRGGGRGGSSSPNNTVANERNAIFEKVSFKQKFRLTSSK